LEDIPSPARDTNGKHGCGLLEKLNFTFKIEGDKK